MSADAMRRQIDNGELPHGRVIVGRMEECTQWEGYWHLEGNDGEYTIALVSTKERAEYLAALLNEHGVRCSPAPDKK